MKLIKKSILFLVAAASLVGGRAYAQRPLIDVAIDSAAILIGEQTTLHLTVTADKDRPVQIVIPNDTLMTGVEVLNLSKADSTEIENDRLVIKQDVLITSFDSSLYLLPPLKVIDGVDTVYSNQVALKVSTIPVNADKPEEFNDIKTVWKPPFVWADYYPIIYGILLALFLICVIAYIVKRIRAKKSLIPFKKEEPKLPPHEQAIKELDYHLNAYARGLKSNRTNTIAVILPTIAHPYFGLIAHCINSSLQKRGYRMLLCDTDYDNEKEQEMIRMAEQNKVDGIIALTYDPKLEVPSEINSVSIDRYLGANIPCVASDNYAGGRLAAEKLMENGCRKLAFLRVGSSIVGETNKRKDGFVAACEAAGVPYEIKNLEDARDGIVFDPMAEFAVFLDDHLQDGVLEFDGIFCVTDRLAYQIVQLLRLMGLRVPEDVQVIGFDGLRTFGDMDYYCSTIVQPVDAIAETCVEVVLNENRANTPSLLCLPVSYAYGGTTKA